MNREEIRKLIQGPIALAPTPFDEDFEVDYGRMADLTEYWVDSGVVTGKSVIKVAAMAGEGFKLSDSEWHHLLRTVVQAARGKAPVMGTIHHKDTVRAIEDARKAQDLGAVALQVSTPDFNDPTQDDMMRFFGALSDAIEIGIVLYQTHFTNNGVVYPETLRRMVDFEHIVGVKWSDPSNYGGRFYPPGCKYEDIFDLANVFNIMDNSNQPVRCHKLGGRGYIQTHISEYPPHDLRVWELLENKQYDEAQTLFDSVNSKLGKFGEHIRKQSGHQIGSKEILAVMGHPCGTYRPPPIYESLSDEEVSDLRKLLMSFGWPVPENSID